MQTSSELVKSFADPQNWYRPAPFWFWNHDLEEAEIRRQVRMMHEGGLGGFFMHARYGLITPYMSEAWHKMIAAAADEARQLNMRAWLYDENNWPSGSAGGQTVRENYRYASSHLKPFIEKTVKGPDTLEIALPKDEEFAIAYAIPIKSGAISGVPDKVKVFTHSGNPDEPLKCKLPTGNWLVLGLARQFATVGFNSITVDAFNRGGIARFIELTHQAYKERFGEDFGELIPGIFFDEISMNYGCNLLPWTDGLLEQFEAKMGYDFTKCVPALLYDVGDEAAKHRADFYGFLTWLYCESTVKQIHDFCESSGLRSTGHFNNEHALSGLAREQGNFFTLAKYMHIPGIDHLGDVTWPIAFSAKMASSASHLLGKERTLCESFGLAKSWALTLKDIKRLGDFELACGINLIVPHAMYYSIEGQRKWECIPNHFYQTAFWPHYRVFSDHAARATLMLSHGSHVADIALYCPFESMHVNDFTGLSERKDLSRFDYYEAKARRTEKDVHGMVQALMSTHHDFDLVDSDILVSAAIKKKQLDVKGEDGRTLESFKCVIIPSAAVVPSAVMKKLQDFAAAGGVVLAAGLLPTASTENGADSAISDAARELFGADPAEVEAKILAGKDPGAGDRYLGTPASWTSELVCSRLDEKLDSLFSRDVAVLVNGKQAQDIVYYHTTYGDEGDVYFFTNASSKNTYYDAIVSVKGPGVPVELGTQTGHFGLPLARTERDGRLEIPLAFTPGQSHMILVHQSTVDMVDRTRLPFRRSGRRGAPVEFVEFREDEWTFRTERGNVLPIMDWKLAMRAGKNMFGFHSLFREYSGTFNVREIPSKSRIVLDGLHPFDIQKSRVTLVVNGTEIKSLEEGEYLDRLVGEADISTLLKRGKNEIQIETTSIFDEAEALGHIVYLVGDFGLELDEDGQWQVVKPKTKFIGSWHEHGYPFYSGVGIYEQELKVQPSWVSYRWIVLAIERMADLVEVVVNDKKAGVLAWEPLELDVMPQLHQGWNKFAIKVTNSMTNLLVMEPTESGLFGKIALKAYPVR